MKLQLSNMMTYLRQCRRRCLEWRPWSAAQQVLQNSELTVILTLLSNACRSNRIQWPQNALNWFRHPFLLIQFQTCCLKWHEGIFPVNFYCSLYVDTKCKVLHTLCRSRECSAAPLHWFTPFTEEIFIRNTSLSFSAESYFRGLKTIWNHQFYSPYSPSCDCSDWQIYLNTKW